MQQSKCPNCNSDVIIEDGAYEHDLVECINCGAELEITGLHPAQLSELKEDEEADEEN